MAQAKRFYNFARDATAGGRELFIDGDIAQDAWFDTDCTPGAFRKELFAEKGDLTLWINSNGGDVIAASQIYTMLMDYQGDVTVKVYGMCASAASVIAMAGTRVLMSPTALMWVHNPWTLAVGDKSEMLKTAEILDEVKEAIINAYEIKTGLSRAKISHLMDDDLPMNVHKAIALGFCDGVLVDEKKSNTNASQVETKLTNTAPQAGLQGNEHEVFTTIAAYQERLNLITGGNVYA